MQRLARHRRSVVPPLGGATVEPRMLARPPPVLTRCLPPDLTPSQTRSTLNTSSTTPWGTATSRVRRRESTSHPSDRVRGKGGAAADLQGLRGPGWWPSRRATVRRARRCQPGRPSRPSRTPQIWNTRARTRWTCCSSGSLLSGPLVSPTRCSLPTLSGRDSLRAHRRSEPQYWRGCGSPGESSCSRGRSSWPCAFAQPKHASGSGLRYGLPSHRLRNFSPFVLQLLLPGQELAVQREIYRYFTAEGRLDHARLKAAESTSGVVHCNPCDRPHARFAASADSTLAARLDTGV